MKAEEFDRRFDAGEDLTKYLDMSWPEAGPERQACERRFSGVDGCIAGQGGPAATKETARTDKYAFDGIFIRIRQSTTFTTLAIASDNQTHKADHTRDTARSLSSASRRAWDRRSTGLRLLHRPRRFFPAPPALIYCQGAAPVLEPCQHNTRICAAGRQASIAPASGVATAGRRHRRRAHTVSAPRRRR